MNPSIEAAENVFAENVFVQNDLQITQYDLQISNCGENDGDISKKLVIDFAYFLLCWYITH